MKRDPQPGAQNLRAPQPISLDVLEEKYLKPGETGTEPERYREEYNGPGHVKLTVWRNNRPERAIVEFNYAMGRYCASLNAAGPDMIKNKERVVFRAIDGNAAPLTTEQVADARWEFNLAGSNLPATIPPDIRRFLRMMS